MKIFSWMQNKLNNGRQARKESNLSTTSPVLTKLDIEVEVPCEEELRDWPHGLLAIGTFGNDNKIQQQDNNKDDFESEMHSSEAEQTDSNETCDVSCNNCPQGSTNLVISRGKDLCVDNNGRRDISKKSLSLLLKKAFVCSTGFDSIPKILRAPISESRTDKIIRAILHKKIYPSSTSKPHTRKYLENKDIAKSICDEGDASNILDDGSKWVKTDSEYIVLEI